MWNPNTGQGRGGGATGGPRSPSLSQCCGREILRIYELMKLRIFDIETNRNQSRIYSDPANIYLRPKTSKSIYPKQTHNEQSVYHPKCLVNSYSRDEYPCHSFDNYTTDLDMTNYEGARIHSFMFLPNGTGSENVDQNAEPYSNQIRTILPPLDSD